MDKFEKALTIAEAVAKWAMRLASAAMRKDAERVDELLRDGFKTSIERAVGERMAEEIIARGGTIGDDEEDA